MEYNSQFSNKEKSILMHNIFSLKKTKENTVENISDYLSENFSKIDGFDYRWNSLISNNPLLFEDIDYFRTKQYINNIITDEEIAAYKRGELRELYATFENMIICNLQYYDRIMSFCTMIFLNYVRLSTEDITKENLENVPLYFDMTPTQIWCCALTNINSTEWELNYAWSVNNKQLKLFKNPDKSLLENNWQTLYKNPVFARFMEYNAFRCGTTGFRETIITDKTSNRKLSQVCAKFTRTSTAISQDQLNSIYEFIKEQELINQKLYVSLYNCMLKLFNGDDTQFAIYVYTKEFYIHSSKFSMKVNKNERGNISKDYLANSYECFAAEEYLFDSIKLQIEWAKYRLPIQYEYDKSILKSLLNQMLKENYKEIICVKRMNDFGILSKVKFSGIFDNVYINEEFMINNRTIRSTKICLSKIKAAEYLIERGYYLFGLETDVFKFLDINKQSIIDHYSKYCTPVLQHMSTIITLHNLSKNDIIDVVCNGILNPNKINNHNMKFANLKSDINPKKIMTSIMEKQKTKFIIDKKSYWKVVTE